MFSEMNKSEKGTSLGGYKKLSVNVLFEISVRHIRHSMYLS